MSLKRAIKRATKAALKAQNSISQRVVYQQTGPAGYNPNTSTPTRPIEKSYPIPEAWFTSFKTSEIDGAVVQPMDQRMTVYGDKLPFEPKMRDYVLDEKGVQWEVMDYKGPISGAVHIFRVRRP